MQNSRAKSLTSEKRCEYRINYPQTNIPACGFYFDATFEAMDEFQKTMRKVNLHLSNIKRLRAFD